jgi:uncharacterized membrane protein
MLWLLSLLACTCSPTLPPDDPAAPSEIATTPGPTSPTPDPITRGRIVRDGARLRFTPCEGDEALTVDDRVGDLAQYLDDAGLAGEAGAYVELHGERRGGRFDANGVSYAELLGPGCTLSADWELFALGHEPEWTVAAYADRVVMARPSPPERVTFSEVDRSELAGMRVWRASHEGRTLQLSIVPGRCIDAVTGAWLPQRAELVLDGTTFEGCGRQTLERRP